MALSKIRFKELKKIKQEKQENCFWLENPKVIVEIINKKAAFIQEIFIVKEATNYIRIFEQNNIAYTIAEEFQIDELGSLKQNRKMLALIKKPLLNQIELSEITLILETVQDPGNLGTIIRTAHWFGIKNIICSEDCVDVYNPKCLQSCMGSFLHVNVYYRNLALFFNQYPTISIYTSSLQGEPLKKIEFDKEKKMFLVLGNESKGVSDEIIQRATKTILIEGNQKEVDSLNVAIANSILLYHITNELKK